MNLLPDDYKQELKYEIWWRFIRFFGFYLIIIMITLDVLLLPSYFFLALQLDQIKERLGSTTNSIALQRTFSGEEQMRKSEDLVKLSAGIAAKKLYISPLVEDILGKTTASTTLSSFQYTNVENGKAALKISGFVSSRDELLLYIAKLKESPYIADVDSPISNYLDERGGAFSLTGDLVP